MHEQEELVDCRPFGELPNGEQALLFTLRNGRGLTARITNFGATLVSLLAPDRRGCFANVLLGYDDLQSYRSGTHYLGALIGRYANRIAGARFTLQGQRHELQANDGATCLHGGGAGFDKVLWTARRMHTHAGNSTLILEHVSPHLTGGFPGELHVEAAFTLAVNDTLTVALRATTDRTTVLSLTSHPYFNLTGSGGRSDILGHELQIISDRMLPIDNRMIPTGELRPVENTPFDFRTPLPIGLRIDADDPQLRIARGYDHCWLLDQAANQEAPQVRVYEPVSGRVPELRCATPGLQFYSGNFLDGRDVGRKDPALCFRSGFCLEPEQLPDAPNQPDFASATLRPEEEYRSTFSYRFGVRDQKAPRAGS